MKTKFLGLLGATLLLVGMFFCLMPISARAAELIELTGLRITDLAKPVAGRALDRTARIRTNENVTWEIPVIWTDENGNTATVAEPGKTYYPNFAFFIPDGYKISEKSLANKNFIKIPDFLIQLFGSDSLVFVADADLGITYISFLQARQGTTAAVDIGRNNEAIAEVAPAPVAEPAVAPAYNPEPIAPAPAPAPTVSAIVERYCSDGAIAFCGNDFLESTIDLIKNRLQPQATNLLMEKIAEAEEDEEFPLDSSSAQIDLYIYYAQNDYSGTDYDKVLAIDLAGIAIKDENDNPCIPDANKAELDGKIVEGMTEIIKADYNGCSNWDDSVLATDADDLPLDWNEDAEAAVYVIAD